jgi:hypothetical protein
VSSAGQEDGGWATSANPRRPLLASGFDEIKTDHERGGSEVPAVLRLVRIGASNPKTILNYKLATVLSIPKFAKSMPRGVANFGIATLGFL